jgi:hypothetical protein
MNIWTGFTIISQNSTDNTLQIRPYSPLFKYPQDTYPVYNLSVNNLDGSADINTQIAAYCEPIIRNILATESGTTSVQLSTFDEQVGKITLITQEQINNLKIKPVQKSHTPISLTFLN